ncbi:MAG: hypothetical protein AB7F28_05360 [Candidatus Margulisiibacteriota bacterium]
MTAGAVRIGVGLGVAAGGMGLAAFWARNAVQAGQEGSSRRSLPQRKQSESVVTRNAIQAGKKDVDRRSVPMVEVTPWLGVSRDVVLKAAVPISAVGPAVFATAFTYPLSLLATLQQQTGVCFVAAFRTVTHGGKVPLNLFSGLQPILYRAIPQRVVQFTFQQLIKDLLGNHTDLSDRSIRFWSGFGTALVDSAIMGPAEFKSIAIQIAKQNGQDWKQVYKNFSKSRGALFLVLRDLIANLAGVTVPQEVRSAFGVDHDHTGHRLWSTFLAISIANLVTTPADVMKLQSLLHRDKSIIGLFKKSYHDCALYSGFGLRVVRTAGSFALTMAGAQYIYDKVFKPLLQSPSS